MARKHVARHVKKLQMHQQRHRKHVWKVFKKLARHKACYAKGGMMLYGMGMAKKKKAGMMLKYKTHSEPELPLFGDL